MSTRAERILEHAPKDVEAVVILSSHFVDRTFVYVSGVARGGYEGCGAILRRGKKPLLLVSRLEEESAKTSSGCELAVYASVAEQRRLLQEHLGQCSNLGIHSGALTKARADELAELLPKATFTDVTAAIVRARLVKDPEEVAKIRDACRITDEVAAQIPSMLREGITEAGLAARIAFEIQQRGGKPAFDSIVCFGANGAEPHYSPGEVPLRKNDMILIDFGAQSQGYCADITRMYLFGKASAEQREMFEVVQKAQDLGVRSMCSGVSGREVHRLVRDSIEATKFAGRFIHGTGHSIGLDVHDGPGLSEGSEITLQPGMVLTVEPGVYIPGLGGVRIEDSVLVTEGEPESLTRVRRDLVEVPS